MSIEKKNIQLNKLVLSGLMIALTFLAGSIIKIPSLGGYIQLGDCMIFLSVVLLGRKRGALTGAIGMALVDIYGGFLLWAPFTFAIKGIMGYIAGNVLGKFEKKTIKVYILSFSLASVFMVVSYFIAGIIMVLILTGKANSFNGAIIYSAKDIIGNIIQVTVAIVIAVPLSEILSNIEKSMIHLH